MKFNCKNKIILENERTRLEPIDWRHFDDLLSVVLKYPDLPRYSPSNYASETGLRDYFEMAFKQRKKQVRYAFVIYDKAVGEYLGSTSFGNISNEHKRVEIGWTWIAKDRQRTGLNRHNKFLMLSYAFENLQFERVELKTDSRNQQSRQAIEGIGASYEGALRSHTLMFDGYRRDSVYYSILKSEWEGIKNTVFANINTAQNPKIDQRKQLEQRPFTYKIAKDNKLLIYRDNKQIKIIRGKTAEDFITLSKQTDTQTIQLKLAKLTGHYKHGNER